MKNKWNILLLLVFVLSSLGCVCVWFIRIDMLLYLTAIPFFSLQLLLCRVSRRWWLRWLPLLPVLLLFSMAGFYLVRYSGWDTLAALILGLAAIAPTVGITLGWGVWALCLWIKKDG